MSAQLRQHALHLLSAGQWAACVALLQQAQHARTQAQEQGATTQHEQLAWITSSEALQALIIARTHVHAASKAWSAVLCLDDQQGSVTARDPAAVQRAYRKAAVRVHPDKCALPGVANAFQLIHHACQRLLATHKAAQHAGDLDPSDGDDGHSQGVDVACGQGDLEDADGDDEFSWWRPWECCGHVVPPMPSTTPTSEDEDPALWHVPLEELQEHVADCQRSVFQPVPGLTIHQRQRRLRFARSVLSERTAQESHCKAREAWGL